MQVKPSCAPILRFTSCSPTSVGATDGMFLQRTCKGFRSASRPTWSTWRRRQVWRTHRYRRFLEELGIEDNGLSLQLYATFSSTSSYKLFDDVLPALDRLKEKGYR